MVNPPPPATEQYLRPARISDVATIHSLLFGYAQEGNLLPRNREDIAKHLREFLIYEKGGEIMGTGALEILGVDLCEIRSLAVSTDHRRAGIGRDIALRLIHQARELGLERLIALTYVPAFFEQLGFEPTDRDNLPEKIWQVCIKCYKFQHCDEIAMMLSLATDDPAPAV